MKLNIRRAALAALVSAASLAAFADPIVNTVDRTFGTGSDHIYFVIDWNDGPDDSLNWRFNYNDGDYGSVYDAMVALETADSALDFVFADFGFGEYLDGMHYNDGSETHGVTAGTSPAPRDWISLWEGDASGSSWTSSSAGVTDITPTTGYAYGLNYEADWNNPSTAPNAVPEPALVGLLLGGLGLTIWLRRARSS